MDRRVVFSHVDLLRCATAAAQAISTTPAQGVFHTALAVSAYGLKPIQHQHLSTEDHVLGHECGYSNPWGPRLRSDPEQKPWRPCRYGQLHKMRQCVCVCTSPATGNAVGHEHHAFLNFSWSGFCFELFVWEVKHISRSARTSHRTSSHCSFLKPQTPVSPEKRSTDSVSNCPPKTV